MDKKVEHLRDWIKTQPQLPQKIENSFLKLCLLSRDGNTEDAKVFLEQHFKFRTKHEHFFLNRDPEEKKTQKSLEVENFLLLPGRTPKNQKIFLNRLNDRDPAKYNFNDIIKSFFMMTDMYLLDDDVDHEGVIVIFDMSGYTWRQHIKASLGTLRMFMKAVQEIYPIPFQEIHVINATPFMETIARWIRPMMRSHFSSIIQIHLPHTHIPFENIPNEMLPLEYGGKAGKVADLRKYWIRKLTENRDYLVDDSRWRYRN